MGNIKQLRYWAFKVLPLTYDNSLSYYEVVEKVVTKLNELVTETNKLPEYISKEVEEQLKGNGNIYQNLFGGLINAIATDEGDGTYTPDEKHGGEIFWLDGKLYQAVSEMQAGTNYIIGTNIVPVDVDTELKNIENYICSHNEYWHSRATANHDTNSYLFWKDNLYRVDADIKENDILKIRATENGETTGQLSEINAMDEITAHYLEMHEADNNLQTQIDENNNDINKNKEDITFVNNRISNIVAQAGNDNTEIVDGRKEAQILGEQNYPTIGDAIRGQITDLYKSGLRYKGACKPNTKLTDVNTYAPGIYSYSPTSRPTDVPSGITNYGFIIVISNLGTSQLYKLYDTASAKQYWRTEKTNDWHCEINTVLTYRGYCTPNTSITNTDIYKIGIYAIDNTNRPTDLPAELGTYAYLIVYTNLGTSQLYSLYDLTKQIHYWRTEKENIWKTDTDDAFIYRGMCKPNTKLTDIANYSIGLYAYSPDDRPSDLPVGIGNYGFISVYANLGTSQLYTLYDIDNQKQYWRTESDNTWIYDLDKSFIYHGMCKANSELTDITTYINGIYAYSPTDRPTDVPEGLTDYGFIIIYANLPTSRIYQLFDISSKKWYWRTEATNTWNCDIDQSFVYRGMCQANTALTDTKVYKPGIYAYSPEDRPTDVPSNIGEYGFIFVYVNIGTSQIYELQDIRHALTYRRTEATNTWIAKNTANSKITVIGDSITEHNFRATKNWVEYLKDFSGAIVTNLGKSGTGFAAGNGDDYYETRIDQIPEDTDIIGVAISFNDLYALSGNFGTTDDTEQNSVFGYANHFFTSLINKFPNTQIICYSQNLWSTWQTEPIHTKTVEYMNGIQTICEKNGIPFYNTALKIGLKPWLDEQQTKYFTNESGVKDNTHPNSLGHIFIFNQLYPIFEKSIPVLPARLM